MTRREMMIKQRLQYHYNDLLKEYPEERVIGVFLHGSQNYNVDTEFSDIDTRAVILPSFDEICKGQSPTSRKITRHNDEHIDVKDIRVLFKIFCKQSVAFLEILYTDFKIVNPTYEQLWKKVEEYKEEIVKYNPYAIAKNIKGFSMEKYHSMEHRYPSKIEIIDKYGYDPKQLHHLLRLQRMLFDYIAGEPFARCLKPKDTHYLIKVKQGYYTLPEARRMAKTTIDYIVNTVDDFCEENQKTSNPEVERYLEEIQAEFIKKSLRAELLEEKKE